MENEVHIKDISSRLATLSKSIISFFTGFIKFIIKGFYITIPLIILAIVAGYYLDVSTIPDKTAKIILRQNFDSVDYLYESIQTIAAIAEAEDLQSLENMGLSGLTEIKIQPIIDMNVLLKSSLNTTNLEALLNEVPVDKDDKDGTTLTSKSFNNSYLKHEIILEVKNDTNKEIIDTLEGLINNNIYYSNIKEQILANFENQIEDNKIIINQIDSLIQSSYDKPAVRSDLFAAQLSDSDLNSLVNTKKSLVNQISTHQLDAILSQQTFMILNKPTFSQNKIKIRDRNLFLLPMLALIILFLTYSYRSLNRK